MRHSHIKRLSLFVRNDKNTMPRVAAWCFSICICNLSVYTFHCMRSDAIHVSASNHHGVTAALYPLGDRLDQHGGVALFRGLPFKVTIFLGISRPWDALKNWPPLCLLTKRGPLGIIIDKERCHMTVSPCRSASQQH